MCIGRRCAGCRLLPIRKLHEVNHDLHWDAVPFYFGISVILM